MTTTQVAVRDLKAGLSRYLTQAQAGQVIEVTSHSKPVALLVGIPPARAPGLAHLLATGAAQWQGKKPSLRPPVELGTKGQPLSRLVLEDRS